MHSEAQARTWVWILKLFFRFLNDTDIVDWVPDVWNSLKFNSFWSTFEQIWFISPKTMIIPVLFQSTLLPYFVNSESDGEDNVSFAGFA